MKTSLALLLVALTMLNSQAQTINQGKLIWTVGLKDNGWPVGDGGGAHATFVQENGSINPLPGDPASPEVNQQADNDYYFAGVYTNVIPSITAIYGDYTPVGTVTNNEEAAERAFAGGDLDLRYHFNLPTTLKTNDFMTVTFAANNLDTSGSDARFGVEIYFNGFLVHTQVVVHPADLETDFTTPQFSLASVKAKVGPGFDNIVSLKGISYNSDNGGNWMGVDYIQLSGITSTTNTTPLPLLLSIGKDDNAWPVGDGGGANATFVQENGTINPLPGSPTSPEVNQQADNDYYFAGVYTNVISSVTNFYGPYTPVGVVAANEEAAERAFAGGDDDLRYHFNLPSTLKPFDLLSVSFDALNLDDPGAVNIDPRYGVAVYFNGVLVQPEILVHPVDLGTTFTTAQFRLDSVNAQVGPGFDNIVSLQGVNYGADGGGQWMGIDYVQVNAGSSSLPPDTNAPTVVSVTRYGDPARLQVTFSEPVRATTAKVAANYALSGGQTITSAVVSPDGKSVILTTSAIAIGATNTLTVTGVADIAGNVITSAGNHLNFTTKPRILFVTADPGPLTFAGDQAILARLQARGFNVTLTTGTAVPDDGSTALGMDLVIISSSLGSGTVLAASGAAKFLKVPVPVIEWESALIDDFKFSVPAGSTTDGQTQLNIVNPNSPLAAGFPAGALTVLTSTQTFSFGTPIGAHIIATISTNSTEAAIFYYDKGEQGVTNSFTMPARRIFFFLQDNTASVLNAAGLKLFDAAVDFGLITQPSGDTNAPTLPFLLTVGVHDNNWPVGDGGGANATFVQENGAINPLPGDPASPEVNQQADNDYYFAGVYSTTIGSVTNSYGDYTPVGVVSANEEAAERAFAGADNDLRYHFNLPDSLKQTDQLSVTFAALNLDTSAANTDPRYGIEIFFNGVLVQPEIVIRQPQVEVDYTSPAFTLASVNAKTGAGFDNIVSLKGVNYSADGGGSWMGIDYVQVNAGPAPAGAPAFLPAKVSGGKITLAWTGAGNLEWAPAVSGPWTAVSPTPNTPYSETIIAGGNRYYRLRAP